MVVVRIDRCRAARWGVKAGAAQWWDSGIREMCSPVDTNYMKCLYLQQPAVMDGWRGGVRRQRGDMDGRVERGGGRWTEMERERSRS